MRFVRYRGNIDDRFYRQRGKFRRLFRVLSFRLKEISFGNYKK